LPEAAAFWSAVVLEALLLEEAFWSAVLLLGVVVEEAAFWSVELGVVELELGLVLELGLAAFWSVLVLVVLLVEDAALWSVLLLAGGLLTGALALSLCPPAGLVVVAAGALLVLEEEAAFWSVEEGVVPCAGGFTGALALSPWVGAWVVLVVAAGALALLVSLVGACALPGVTGVLPVLEEAALWSEELPVVEVVEEAALWSVLVLEAAAPIEPAPELEAWLLVQESEIMFTELTCSDPSLERVPWT
jgi:hypothetical protein